MSIVDAGITEGYAPVNGLRMYWRSLGEGGTPLVVVHGGFGVVDELTDQLGRLAERRRVIAVELQGHGRTGDIDPVPCRRDGWYPGVREAMAHVDSGLFEQFRQSPMYAAYAAVAPDVDAYPRIMDKMGKLLARPFDWTEEVRALPVPTLLVYGDADGVPPSHAAEFFALLGGGLREGGWDGAGRPASQLAILPGRTHYDVFEAPELAAVAAAFLDTPDRG
jgi:pimeloyl-ACP methyl ester carboxylesterase